MKTTLALILLLATTSVFATQGAKAKPKPAAQAGAVQMPGDNGKLMVPYRLGAKGQELVFTLESSAFADRVITTDQVICAHPGKRLLVVNMAVQNPGKSDVGFDNMSFKLTAVSPDDENYVWDGGVYHPTKLEPMSVYLKPAQKVHAFAVIEIHPTDVVNKLIVERGKGNPVLRYDLRDKVKPLTGVFAANEGKDIAELGKAVMGTPFPCGYFDVTIEKVEDSLVPIGDFSLGTGGKLIVVTATYTNVSKAPHLLHSNIIKPKMTDMDGATLNYPDAFMKASSTDGASGMVDPGQTLRVRLLFNASLTTKPAALTMTDQYWYRPVMIPLVTGG